VVAPGGSGPGSGIFVRAPYGLSSIFYIHDKCDVSKPLSLLADKKTLIFTNT
jgi:hypothetical protein